MLDRTLPHNEELEKQVVLATFLGSEDQRVELLSSVSPEWFHNFYFRKLFEVSASGGLSGLAAYDKVWTAHKDLDVRIPKEQWARWISAEGMFRNYNLSGDVEQLRRLYVRRQAIDHASALSNKAYSGDVDLGEYAEEFNRIMLDASSEYDDSAGSVCDEILQDAATGTRDAERVAFGFDRLDVALRGLRRQDFIVLAGQPNTGKSPFGLDALRRRARMGFGHQVVISMEMSKKALVQELVSQDTGVPIDHLTHGVSGYASSDRQSETLGKVASTISWINDHFSIVDSTIGSITRPLLRSYVLKRRSELRKTGKDIDCIFLDYLQLFSRGFEDIKEWTRFLKLSALEWEIPILCVSSLNRQQNTRQGSADRTAPFVLPLMSDLRESGEIEFDATKIIFLLHSLCGGVPVSDKRWLYVLKNKFGPANEAIHFEFLERCLRFEELAA